MTGKRSRDGCWNCRRNRRKCDETKPFCNNCASRGVSCGGYELRLAEFRQGDHGQMVGKLIKGSPPASTSARPKRRPKRAGKDGNGRTIHPTLENSTNSGQDKPSTGSSEDIAPNALRSFASSASGADMTVEYYQPIDPSLDIPMTVNLTASDAISTFSSAGIGGNPPREENSPAQEDGGDASAFDLLKDPFIDISGISFDTFYRSPGLQCDVEGESSVALSEFVTPLESYGAPVSSEHETENETSLNGFDGASTECFQEEALLLQGSRAFDSSLSGPLLETPSALPPHNHIQSDWSGLCFDRDFNHSDISSPFDSFLYSHFFNVLAPCFYPINLERNPYKIVYGKIASSFQPLRSAILGASAVHLSYMGQLPAAVVSLYRDSHHVSISNVPKTSMGADALAATLLLSIVLEFVGSGSDIWTSKLRKVRALLIGERSQYNKDCDELSVIPFLRLHFNWITAIGRTLQDSASFRPESDQLDFIDDQIFGEHAFPGIQERWFSNLPDYECFLLLKEATKLSRTALGSDALGVDGARRLIPDVADLLQRVKHWQPKHSVISALCTPQGLRVQTVWREGLLCYIYADVCALPTSDYRIQECVRRGTEALVALTWMQSSMWPAFLIGVHASTIMCREICLNSFSCMGETTRLAGPLTIAKFLQKVWSNMDQSGTDNSRWRNIMSESGIQLNLVM